MVAIIPEDQAGDPTAYDKFSDDDEQDCLDYNDNWEQAGGGKKFQFSMTIQDSDRLTRLHKEL
jgi:hypothetical protein